MKIFAAVLTVFILASHVSANDLRSVTVTGESSVSVVPDIATLRVGVVETHENAQTAMELMAPKINQIIDVAKGLEIADRDIQTTGLALNINWEERRRNGFVASSTIALTIRDLEKLPEVLSALVDAGLNELSGPVFSYSKALEAENQAMTMAVENAKEKAEQLALLTGMTLGNPIKIDYQAQPASPRVFAMAEAKSFSSFDAPQIEAGELQISSYVTISFELKE